MELKCPGRRRIHVLSANYGREPGVNSGCSLNRPLVKVCREPKSTQIVQRECEGKKSCTVKAANSVFGDPCRGVVKYLRVKYRCDVVSFTCWDYSKNCFLCVVKRNYQCQLVTSNWANFLKILFPNKLCHIFWIIDWTCNVLLWLFHVNFKKDLPKYVIIPWLTSPSPETNEIS